MAAAHCWQQVRRLSADFLLDFLEVVEHMGALEGHGIDDATLAVHVVVDGLRVQAHHRVDLLEQVVADGEVFIDHPLGEAQSAEQAGVEEFAARRVVDVLLVVDAAQGLVAA